jgi:hypothetical protein
MGMANSARPRWAGHRRRQYVDDGYVGGGWMAHSFSEPSASGLTLLTVLFLARHLAESSQRVLAAVVINSVIGLLNREMRSSTD